MRHSSLIKAKIQNSKLFWIFYMALQTDIKLILSVGICLQNKNAGMTLAIPAFLYCFDIIDIGRVRVRVSRFVCIFLPEGKKNDCVTPSSRRQQCSFALHLIFRISINKKEKLTSFLSKPVNFSWSECRDSNSRPLEPHSSAIPNFATPGCLKAFA